MARVAVLAGSAQAIASNGQTRALAEGSALYTGDSVRTDKASHVVLAFRDRSKVTVIANSEFKLEDVRFTGQQSDSGSFAVRIVRGGVRALTGLLAKRDPQAVQFRATTAVIGLRGTGLDTQLNGDDLFVFQWQDVSYLIEGGREVRVDPGAAAIFSAVRNLLQLLDKPPEFFLTEAAPRPDTVEVNFDALFAATRVDRLRGLTVGVVDGDIVLSGPGGFIYLTRDESGYLAQGETIPVRVVPYWEHLLRDPILNLSQTVPGRSGPLEVIGPGGLICEIR